MQQLSKQQATDIFHQGIWKQLNDEQKVGLQLFQKSLCMPFKEFHLSLENLLKRKIQLMEFGEIRNLMEEYQKNYPKPKWSDIKRWLMANKTVQ